MNGVGAGVSEERRRARAHVFVEDLSAPVLADGDEHHLRRVLRLAVGDAVTASDGHGGWRQCALGPDEALVVQAPTSYESARARPLTVAFVVTKGDRPELVVQKLSELGVDRIVPVHSVRSVVRWEGERGARHVERLRRVAREACMQSRQVWLPQVTDVGELHELLDAAAGDLGVALAEPGGGAVDGTVHTVVVGPEGGWSREELAAAPRLVRLPGDGILRSDTAAIVAGVTLVTSSGI